MTRKLENAAARVSSTCFKLNLSDLQFDAEPESGTGKRKGKGNCNWPRQGVAGGPVSSSLPVTWMIRVSAVMMIMIAAAILPGRGAALTQWVRAHDGARTAPRFRAAAHAAAAAPASAQAAVRRPGRGRLGPSGFQLHGPGGRIADFKFSS